MDNKRAVTEEKKDRKSNAVWEPIPGVRLKKSWVWLLVASILLSLAVPLALGGFEQFKLLHRLSWWWAIALAMLAFISWAFNSLRTQMLMSALGQSISFHKAAFTTISAEFAGVSTPAAVGMPATYTFLFHNLGITVGEALGLVGVIVVTDLVYFATIMGLSVLVEIFIGTGAAHSPKLAALVAAVIVGGSLAFAALVLNFRRVYHFVSRQMEKVPWLARKRYSMARGTVRFLRAVRLLKKMSWLQLAKLYFITLGFWLPRYLVLIVVIYLVGANVPFFYLMLVQGVLNMAGQVLLIPGGGGTEDAGYAALLSPYVGLESLAFTLLVWRTYTFYWYLIIGGPIFLYQTGDAARRLLRGKR
jgi:glycosyltransferase 2 family protein